MTYSDYYFSELSDKIFDRLEKAGATSGDTFLQQDYDRLEREEVALKIDSQHSQISELEKTLAEAVSVIQFYGDGLALDADDSWIAHFEYGHMRISTGKRARSFLEKLKKQEEV